MRHAVLAGLTAFALSCGCGSNSLDESEPSPRSPILDAPWAPAQSHVDAPYTQEVGRMHDLDDVRAVALGPGDVPHVATAAGTMRWTGTAWTSVGIPQERSSTDVAFDAVGAMSSVGPSGAWIDGEAVDLPDSAVPSFIAPRRAGGWWIAGADQAGYWDDAFNSVSTEVGLAVRGFADLPDGSWYAATADGLFAAGTLITTSEGLPSNDVRSVIALEDGTLWVGTAAGLAFRQGSTGQFEPFLGADGLHYGDILDLATDASGALLVSTSMGASRYHADGSRRYYLGRLWLPDNHVVGMARAADGTVWFATAGGVSMAEQRSMTLADKAKQFDTLTQERHVRLGYTSTENRLIEAGDVTTATNGDDDNDGQWTAMYLASQSYRYAVTGEEEARSNAQVAAMAMLRLEEADGLDGFFARSVVPPEQCPDKQQPNAGEWHLSDDGQWCWKGDTSSDEFVGHVFGLSLFYDLAATEDDKREVEATFGKLIRGIMESGYLLLDVDGKVTEHGNFDPDWMHNSLVARFGDAGLNSAMILGGLHAAYHMTGDAVFRKAFNTLARTEDYADNVRRIEEINLAYHTNHDSEEMSFLAMFTLMRYEDDPALLALWREGLDGLWAVQRPERNPEFNIIYAALSRADAYDHDNTIETLQGLPVDLVLWGLNFDHRWDAQLDPNDDRFGRPQNAFVFPYRERQVMRWAENPYAYEQRGDGHQESSGTFWLLPYWMGRYYQLIR